MAGMIELNGRRYRKPERAVVVICVDGFDPAYVERGVADGILPTIARFAHDGWVGAADAVMPTFTNPNNVSIVTGAPPSVHGIAGNYTGFRCSPDMVEWLGKRTMFGGIDDAGLLLSQRTGCGGAAALSPRRERACVPAGSDDRQPARRDGA